MNGVDSMSNGMVIWIAASPDIEKIKPEDVKKSVNSKQIHHMSKHRKSQKKREKLRVNSSELLKRIPGRKDDYEKRTDVDGGTFVGVGECSLMELEVFTSNGSSTMEEYFESSLE